jgi:hypothetical protein
MSFKEKQNYKNHKVQEIKKAIKIKLVKERIKPYK